jgi:outer membrane protein assembly factor BamB
MLRVVLVATRDGDVTWERSAPSTPSLGLVHQVLLSTRPGGRLVPSDQWSVAVTVSPHVVALSTSTVQPWSLTSKSKTVSTASQIKVLVGEVLGAVLGLALGAEDGDSLGEELGALLGTKLGDELGI